MNLSENAAARSLHMEALPNARELGGYVTEDGREVVRGRLLRTAALAKASPEDLRRLSEEYQLKLILDLRDPREAAEKPDPDIPGTRYVNIPIIDPDSFDVIDPDEDGAAKAAGGSGKQETAKSEEERKRERFLAAADTFHELTEAFDGDGLYSMLLMSPFGSGGYRRFFREILLAPEGAVLWHCSQGKDRTGIAAALLLAALGVSEETILSDYLLTNEFCGDRIGRAKEMLSGYGYAEELIDSTALTMEGATEAYMCRLFAEVKKACGTMRHFLRERLLLSEEDLAVIRERFLVPVRPEEDCAL